jgi:hypothetical protein
MGYMAIEVKRTDSDVVRYQVEIPDADIVRISTAHAEIFFPEGVVVSGDPNADPPVPDSVRMPNGQDVLEASAKRLIAEMVERSVGWERKKALRLAEQSVAPITVVDP